MNSVFTFRRSDEFAPNLDINGGTALDCSVNGNTLVISDQNDFIYLNTENGSSERKRRPVNKTVRMIRCHPRRQNVFAAVDRYNVEFWQGSSKVLSVAKTRITDFDFDHFDENRSIVATAESVTLVDSRSQSRLPLLFGATQAKFSPAAENFFYTAHVTDIRCFDVRNMKAPCRQFVSSGHERQILTMELHPTDSNVLVTSTTNEAKLWNCSTETIQPHILDYSNIKKFVFSQNGDVFAGLNFASSGKLETSVKLWQITSLGNAQELRHNVTDFIDLCWLKTTSQNQYLFTLSKKNNLFRHLVVPNIQTETVMMRAPISRNAEDEAIDQMALVSKKSVRGTHPNVPKPKSSNPLDSSEFRSNCVVESNAKSWSCWLRAPSIACEDLLFELNSVRKLNLLGLSCNEVNFQRAAIGLSYSHFGIYKKISVEIRFHRNFIENGFVFIELLKKDSPLNLQTAKMLLNQLSEEAWKQHRKESNLSVLARTLLQLQPITDSIHVFPPVNAEILEQSRHSLAHDESESSRLSERFLSTDKESQSSFAANASPYDSNVPSPRLGGGRFSQSGFLCLFGQTECLFNITPNSRDEKPKSVDEPINKNAHISRLLISKSAKNSIRLDSPQQVEQYVPKKPTRLFLNRHEPTQQAFMRTLSDYTTQHTMERGANDIPETNHSFTMFYNETRADADLDTRRRLSSITLEDSASMSTSLVKTSKSTTLLSPIRRRRGISMTSCVTADSSLDTQLPNSIIILDTTIFQNVSRVFGQHYRLFGGSVSEVCYHNMWVVAKYAPYKQELISLWQILYEFFNSEEERRANQPRRLKKHRNKPSVDLDSISVHPLDRRFIFYFIEYYYMKFDVQTASILFCILMRSIDDLVDWDLREIKKKTTPAPTSAIKHIPSFDKFLPVFMSKENDKFGEQLALHHRMSKPNVVKKSQSELNYSDNSNNNSNSTSLEQRQNYFPPEKPELDSREHDSEASNSTLQLEKYNELTLVEQVQKEQFGLTSELKDRLEQICLEYSVMLCQWGFLNQRAELFKCIKNDRHDADLKQVVSCTHCNSLDSNCSKCRPVPIICMVCDEECKGLITVCKVCSHGGHLSHVSEYFAVFDACPYCGCRCK